MTQLIEKYFPGLTSRQLEQFRQMESVYREWNQKINVISRKDIGHFYEHHVLHSLAIARFTGFIPGTSILDGGTGGGFPGIPLAVMFPECHFTLADSIGKKIKVVQEISRALGLDNVEAKVSRIEQLTRRYDFVVSRAVTAFPDFVGWCRGRILPQNRNSLPNGIIYLKGDDLAAEKALYGDKLNIVGLSTWYTEAFFETKKLIYLPAFH